MSCPDSGPGDASPGRRCSRSGSVVLIVSMVFKVPNAARACIRSPHPGRCLLPAPLPVAVADEPAPSLRFTRRRRGFTGCALPHLAAPPPHLAHPLPQRVGLRIARVIAHQSPSRRPRRVRADRGSASPASRFRGRARIRRERVAASPSRAASGTAGEARGRPLDTSGGDRARFAPAPFQNARFYPAYSRAPRASPDRISAEPSPSAAGQGVRGTRKRGGAGPRRSGARGAIELAVCG